MPNDYFIQKQLYPAGSKPIKNQYNLRRTAKKLITAEKTTPLLMVILLLIAITAIILAKTEAITAITATMPNQQPTPRISLNLALQDTPLSSPNIDSPNDDSFAEGIGSWYDYNLNGLTWSKEHDTCASRDFPRYSYLRVIADNGNEVICFVNDYGPEQWTGRIIDLSSHAFKQLAPLSQGLIKVKIKTYVSPLP